MTISPKFHLLRSETRRESDQVDSVTVRNRLVFKEESVSEVGIEPTTRGFSIPNSERSESGAIYAGFVDRTMGGALLFDRNLAFVDTLERVPLVAGPGAIAVPLGGTELVALVDAADAPRVLELRWHLKRAKKYPGRFYAQHTVRLTPGRNGKKANLVLHRFIFGEDAPPLVDHKNGNGLDCRRDNMRAATTRQNSTNVTLSKQQKIGGYKGVSWNPRAKKWQTSICAGVVQPNGRRKLIYLGVFTDPAAAARAYDAAALLHFGEFACINFPSPQSGHLTTMEPR